MRLGALLGPIDGTEPHAIADQASRLEAEGYASIWTAQAIGRGFMMPDPFVALSAAAAVTRNVELGTAILQLPLYHPSEVALKVFSLMQISGSRFILGVGAGSTEADFRVHELDYQDRFRQFDHKLEKLRTLLSAGRINDSSLSPWPSVNGGPPIFYGSWTRGAARAASEFDGWIGSAMHRTPDELEVALGTYRAAGGTRAIVTTIQLGRDTDTMELKDRLAQFSSIGFDDAVVMFLPGAPSAEEVRKLC